MKQKRWYFLLALFLAMCLAIFLVYSWLSPKTQQIDDAESLLYVQTVLPKLTILPETYDTIAVLKPLQQITIKNALAGQIESINFAAGSKVAAGDLLLSLKPSLSIRAPISGQLTDWHVALGEQLSANTSIIEIVNAEKLKVTYKVPEQYSSKIALNQNINFSIRAYPNDIFTGKVSYISPIIDLDSHNILVTALVSNIDNKLIPGAFVELQHILNPNQEQITIPKSAVITNLYGNEIYVINKSGEIEQRKITLGSVNNSWAQIASGLQLNEEVVIAFNRDIVSGKKVKTEIWRGDW